jgi:hypothetical protein
MRDMVERDVVGRDTEWRAFSLTPTLSQWEREHFFSKRRRVGK